MIIVGMANVSKNNVNGQTTKEDNMYNGPNLISDVSSIKKLLIETERNLQALIQLDNDVFDTMVNKLQLFLLQQLKQAIIQLKPYTTNTSNTTVTTTENKQDIMDNNINIGNTVKNSDNVSVMSDKTGITGVSSIAAPISMNDPLIVIMGIGEYDGMPNLDGISKDYENIIDTFVNHWKYKIFYQLNDSTFVYTNNENELKRNYKLKWDGDEIDAFIEESRKHLVKNKHNGLIFAISSHGDRGKVLYDSECEIYELDAIFSMYSPQGSHLLESYTESQEESNRLFSIPKIFFLDMCRGDGKAKVTKIVSNNENKDENDQETSTQNSNETKVETLPVATPKSDEIETQNNSNHNKENAEQVATAVTVPDLSPDKAGKATQEDATSNGTTAQMAISLHKNIKKQTDTETFQAKGISKEDAHILVGQMANFAKIFANVEGFSVADGSQNGGIFLRNVCRVFKDTKFVSKNKFTQLVFKIREYTKREATLMGTLFNFTQIVENEGTLERPVVFGSKYNNIIPSIGNHNINYNGNYNDDLATIDETNDDDDEPQENDFAESMDKIRITNTSKEHDIAVLVEMEQTRENRHNMLQSLKTSDFNVNNSNGTNITTKFAANGFVIIGKNNQFHEFDKVWDEYFVTLFCLSDNLEHNEHSLIGGERQLYFENDLYFKNNQLYQMNNRQILPKCNLNENDIESHWLNKIVITQESINCNPNLNKCTLCLDTIEMDAISYYCAKCKRGLCHKCCDCIICEKTPLRLTIPHLITQVEQTNMRSMQVEFTDMRKDLEYKLEMHMTNGTATLSYSHLICLTDDSVFNTKNSTKNSKNSNDRDEMDEKNDSKSDDKISFDNDFELDMDDQFDTDNEFESFGGGTGWIGTFLDNVDENKLNASQTFKHTSVIELNIDELQKEFKESELTCQIELIVIDTKNKMQCSLHPMINNIPIWIRIGQDYACTFTTLNGEGRFGPTNMDDYKNGCHFNDVTLEMKIETQIKSKPKKNKLFSLGKFGKSKKNDRKKSTQGKDAMDQNISDTTGMQLWTIPKTGKYKIVCYGAKGGDSDGGKGGKGAKVGSTLNLFKNDIIKMRATRKYK